MPGLIKRDQTRQPYDEAKLRASLTRALEKRPVSVEQIEEVLSRIVHRLRTTGEREVTTQFLGEQVMAELRELDEVAYVRFASVYRSFQDVTEFQEEIKKLQGLSDGTNEEQMSLLSELEANARKRSKRGPR